MEGRKGSRTGQREKQGSDTVARKALADPIGGSGAGMAPQSSPKLEPEGQNFLLPQQPVIGYRLSQRRGWKFE